MFNAYTGKMAFSMITHGTSQGEGIMPYTCIRWRPTISSDAKSSSVLVTTASDGVIQHWHMNTGKC